jgi:protease I
MAKVAMLLGPEFEDSEFRVPYDRLKQANHEVTVIGTAEGETMHGKRGRESARIDAAATNQNPRDFDALVIPGGHSPDHLRIDRDAVSFVREFANSGKPVAAICHGPQLLIEAGLVAGKTVTSWPSVRKDLENAGANWVDREVVQDGTFITSRKPEDLPAFSNALLAALHS